MRIEKNRDGTAKVFYNQQDEWQNLIRTVNEQEKLALYRLMGKVGLRLEEALRVCYDDFKRQQDGSYYLYVDCAKDTTGEFDDGKSRTVKVPDYVERTCFEYKVQCGLENDEKLFDITKRTVQNWVYDTGDILSDEYGNSNWKKLSPHDMRRSLANHYIHNTSVSPSVVMQIFGWEDWATLKNYTTRPSQEIINENLESTDIFD